MGAGCTSQISSSDRGVPRSALRRLRAGRRIALAIVALFVLPLTFSSVAAAQAEPYNVLVFTKNATVGASEGAAALQAARRSGRRDARRQRRRRQVHRREPGHLPRRRVPQHSGDVLDDTQQAAFEAYFRAGGGFLGTGSAIETEPSWPFMTDILGTRSTSRTDATQATVKVADRGHDASKELPEYWVRSDRWYNFTSNVRGLSHVLATVDEKTFTGGTMGFDHPIAWCKDYQGGRSFYTGGGGTADAFGEADFRKHLGGALKWAAGKSDKDYSDCGATVLANYQQTKISAPPNLLEPIGFDVLRRRSRHPDVARRRRSACTIRRPARRRSSPRSPSTRTARTACTGRRSTTTSRPTSGSTSTTRRRRCASRSATARRPT